MVEGNQDTKISKYSTCIPDGITVFKCDECQGSGWSASLTKTGDGYYNYQQGECPKCQGAGLVDWVGNACF